MVGVIETLRAGCNVAGFDIVHPFRLDWFNDIAPPDLRLPDGGRPRALGVVIANTRHLWPVFARVLADNGALADEEHPLDTYVERAITRTAEQSIPDAHRIFFAHRLTPAPIAIQRIAHASGLAHLSPSRLSVHARLGPWLSLRAVIVVDVEGPPGTAISAPDPCTPCAKPCMAAFERAMAATDLTRAGDVERQWKSWVNVRDVCPEGRTERFDDDQVRYHYAKERAILLNLAHRG